MSISRFGDGIPVVAKGDILTHNGTSASRLPVGSDLYVLTSQSSATSGLVWSEYSTTAIEYAVRISSTTVTSASAEIVFSSIPGSYKNLVVEGSLRGDDTTGTDSKRELRIRFNSVTTGYRTQSTDVTNASGITSNDVSTTSIDGTNSICCVSTSTQLFSSFRFSVISYAQNSTDYKAVIGTPLGAMNYTAALSKIDHGYFSGQSGNTEIITSITLFLSTGNFDVGSTAHIYGTS